MNPGNTNSQFCQRIAGKYGTSFFHRRRFPLLVHLLYRRGTGEPIFRPPVILEKNITVLSRLLNRMFHFHHHLHFNVNVVFQKYESYFHSTLPANQVRFFPSFPIVTSHYHRPMYFNANPRSVFQSLAAGDSTNITFQTVGSFWSFLFPRSPVFQSFSAGDAVNLTYQTTDNRWDYLFQKSPVFQNVSAANSMNSQNSLNSMRITYRSVDNQQSLLFPHSTLFREIADRMLMKKTVHKEKVTSSRHSVGPGRTGKVEKIEEVENKDDNPIAPAGNREGPRISEAHTHIEHTLVAKYITPAPGATTAAGTTAAAVNRTPAVLTPLTGRIPLTSLAHLTPLTPLTSRALAHNPTTVTAAKARWFSHSELPDLSKRSNQSDRSDQFRGKRPGTPTLEHPQPGPGVGSGVGSRKAAPRSLESLERYEAAPSTTAKTSAEKIVNETVSTHSVNTQESKPPEVDLHRLTDQVYRMLEKKIKTERERRGW